MKTFRIGQAERFKNDLGQSVWVRMDEAISHLVGRVILINAGSGSDRHGQYEAILARISADAARILNDIQTRKDAAQMPQHECSDLTPSVLMLRLMDPYRTE